MTCLVAFVGSTQFAPTNLQAQKNKVKPYYHRQTNSKKKQRVTENYGHTEK
jgi:hypothetical protein